MKKYLQFIKNQKSIVLFSSIIAIVVYGFRITHWSIGRDTDLYIKYGISKYQPWGETGKVGLLLLKKIDSFLEFDIYFANIMSLILLIIGTVTWCYFLYYFSGRINKIAFAFFSAFYMTSGVIVEHYSFTLQNVEVFFALVLVPVAIILFYESIVKNNYKLLILDIIVSVFLVTVYQAILLMICAGVIISFILIYENSDKKNSTIIKKYRWILPVYIAITTVLYFIINKVCIILIFKNSSTYLTDKVTIYNSIGEYCKNIVLYLYMLIFGNSKIAARVINPFLIQNAHGGKETVDNLHLFFNGVASILFLVVPLIFYIFIIRNKNKTFTYLFYSAMLIPCMIFFFVIGSGEGGIRVHMALPIVLSFMIWYIICNCRKTVGKYGVIIILLLSLIIQINRSVHCFSSDYLVFKQDEEICHNIDKEVKSITKEKVKLIIIGKFKEKTNNSMRKTFIFANSVFNWGEKGKGGVTIRSTSFMHGLGIDYEPLLDNKEIDMCKSIANEMPSYPNKGFVRKNKDIVIVKLSNE